MRELLCSEVWFLLILAAVLGAILTRGEDSNRTAKLAAFFTVLGDAMTLLALVDRANPANCES